MDYQHVLRLLRFARNDKAGVFQRSQSVITGGTARSLKPMGISFPVAGKTGTTNDYKDTWFIGYTPDILALVWVGFDDGDSIHATGSAAALASLRLREPGNI